MMYLVKNWNYINFNDYELVKDKNWNFSIIIEKRVKIQYVHCHFDKKTNKITRYEDCDVKYNKIWEYIVRKYEERKQRMIEPPIFCIMNFATIFSDAIYTDEQLNELSKFDNVRILKGYEHIMPIPAAKIFYEKVLK